MIWMRGSEGEMVDGMSARVSVAVRKSRRNFIGLVKRDDYGRPRAPIRRSGEEGIGCGVEVLGALDRFPYLSICLIER